MDEETDNNAARRVCDACLSGDRDLFSIADPLRLHRLLLGAVTDVDHFVPSAELVAAMALCWECNLNVSKMFRFCERVCRAQMYVGRSDEDRDKESSNVPLSTLNSVIQVGFDLELLHNDDPNIWSSSPPILPSSILDELSGLYCKNSEHRTSNTKTQILVVQEHLNCEYVQELEPEDAVVIPPCYTMKIKNAATENARQTIPITSVRTGDKDILKSTKQTLVIAKMQARNVPVKKQGKIVTILMSEGDMSRRRDEERTTAKYVASPYKCESCIKGYKFVTTLLAHNKKKHDTENNPYYCDICLERFPYDIQRKLHRESHFLLYACTCGFTHHLYAVAKVHCEPMPNVNPADELTVDSTDESLAKPKRNPKRPRDYICHLCNKVFKSRSHLRYHKQARHTDGFPCDVCGKALVTQSALKKHRDIIHGTDVPLLECPECRKQYRGHEALARHKRYLHGAAGPPEQRYCVACGVLYKTRKHYDFHLRTSLKHIDKNKYKYVCSKCEKRFWHPGELKSHEAWHDDESLFQCSICHKCLSNRITLKNHVRFVHEKRTLPKNKVCDVCGHNFNSKSSLENHIRTHTGERPFQCNVCNANFAHSGALYTHNKLKHLKLKRGESVAKGLREQTEADVAQEPTHSA